MVLISTIETLPPDGNPIFARDPNLCPEYEDTNQANYKD